MGSSRGCGGTDLWSAVDAMTSRLLQLGGKAMHELDYSSRSLSVIRSAPSLIPSALLP